MEWSEVLSVLAIVCALIAILGVGMRLGQWEKDVERIERMLSQQTEEPQSQRR